MSKRYRNSQAQPPAAPSAVDPPHLSIKAATGSVETTAAKPKTLVAHMKAWAWRFTAGYFWLHSALTVIAGRDILSGTETAITTKAVAVLSFLGFAPVNVGHLPLVFLVIWLLAITRFSPVQLLIFLPLYIVIFPVTVLLVLVYRKTLKAATSPNPDVQVAPEFVRRFPFASLSAAMLVGWFVLYSGSSSRGPNMAGFLFALALFFTLIYRALDKTSPIDEQDTAFFSVAAAKGLLMLSNLFKKATEEPPKTQLAIASALRIHGMIIGGYRQLGILISGRKGRERIAMVMLLEYIVFLVLVAVSAILFWALAIKAAVPIGADSV